MPNRRVQNPIQQVGRPIPVGSARLQAKAAVIDAPPLRVDSVGRDNCLFNTEKLFQQRRWGILATHIQPKHPTFLRQTVGKQQVLALGQGGAFLPLPAGGPQRRSGCVHRGLDALDGRKVRWATRKIVSQPR